MLFTLPANTPPPPAPTQLQLGSCQPPASTKPMFPGPGGRRKDLHVGTSGPRTCVPANPTNHQGGKGVYVLPAV